MPENYQDTSDEEMIALLRGGKTEITDCLMERYKDLVRGKAKSLYLLGADAEDLIQEGMIGLFKAVRDYDPKFQASFFTFAELCVERQIYSAIQAARRKKHAPLNSYISLYATSDSGDRTGEDARLLAGAAALVRSPEDLFIDKENVERMEKIIDMELSAFEKQVLELYLVGLGYVEIARILGKKPKSADNAMQRIKQKLRRAF